MHVSVQNRVFSALFIVYDKGNGDFGVVWPSRIMGLLAITDEISREVIMIIPFPRRDLVCVLDKSRHDSKSGVGEER